MTPNQAAEILYQAFADAWAASAYSALPFGRDGVPFEPVAGVAAWAVIEVRHAASLQDTLGSTGNRRFETRDVVTVECGAPAGYGRAGAAAVARVVTLAFQGKQLSSAIPGDVVTCEVSQESAVGSDGEWFRFLVSVPFRYYEQM